MTDRTPTSTGRAIDAIVQEEKRLWEKDVVSDKNISRLARILSMPEYEIRQILDIALRRNERITDE